MNEELERRFEDVDRRFEETNRRMDQGFEEVHSELVELRQGQGGLRQETQELRQGQERLRLEVADLGREVRKNGVMVEKLDGDIRLVAEGVVTNRQVMERMIEETRREREEDRRLWRSMAGITGDQGRRLEEVEGRVDGLEVRVSVLEDRDG